MVLMIRRMMMIVVIIVISVVIDGRCSENAVNQTGLKSNTNAY